MTRNAGHGLFLHREGQSDERNLEIPPKKDYLVYYHVHCRNYIELHPAADDAR